MTSHTNESESIIRASMQLVNDSFSNGVQQTLTEGEKQLHEDILSIKPGHSSASALAFSCLPMDISTTFLRECGVYTFLPSVSSLQGLSKALAYFGLIQMTFAYHLETEKEQLYRRLVAGSGSGLVFTDPVINLLLLTLSVESLESLPEDLRVACAEFKREYQLPDDVHHRL